MDLSELHVSRKSEFSHIHRAYYLKKLRNQVMRWMLVGNENDFFDLDQFNRSYLNNRDLMNELVGDVTVELHGLGWKTFLGFGGTGLYVYSSEERPVNAY